MDGARRLGRNAMILSIVSILGGIAAIAATIALNWGREFLRTPLKFHTFILVTSSNRLCRFLLSFIKILIG